ncbi:alanine:cation symporter family protein, partial [Vitellibacter sp. q18]|nr:alanine:cation symporter family protein [Aequorivita lutea]
VQSNNIGSAVETAFGAGSIINTSFFGEVSFAKLVSGVVVVLILGFIIFGGVRRIAKFTEIVVPFMALAYIIIACVIVALNIDQLPSVISMIVGDAFSPMAGFGAAIGWGV